MSPTLDILPTWSPACSLQALCVPPPRNVGTGWGGVMDAQVCTDHMLQALPSAAG